MLGAFVSTLFSTIGRWFVNLLMDTESFAVYSFGVSIENLVISFMTPITVSMYNFFCRGISNEKIKDIKDYATIYSFIIIAAAFPAKWIIERFMPNYIGAVSIIFMLFAAQALATVIKGIHVNLYKARGQQKKYLIQIAAMVGVSFVLNLIMFLLFGTLEAISGAILITNIIWFIVAEIQNKSVKCGIKTIIAIVIVMSTYLICGHFLGAITGMLIYCAVGLITAFTLMRRNTLNLINKFFLILKIKKTTISENNEKVD
jgi:O-antigen/teichoic acid export membrane protein